MGDVIKQLAMKERLGCKSFQWFMENVAYDMLRKYPELPKNLHWGEVSVWTASLFILWDNNLKCLYSPCILYKATKMASLVWEFLLLLLVIIIISIIIFIIDDNLQFHIVKLLPH